MLLQSMSLQNSSRSDCKRKTKAGVMDVLRLIVRIHAQEVMLPSQGKPMGVVQHAHLLNATVGGILTPPYQLGRLMCK